MIDAHDARGRRLGLFAADSQNLVDRIDHDPDGLAGDIDDDDSRVLVVLGHGQPEPLAQVHEGYHVSAQVDQSANVVAAQELGIHAIQYFDYDQMLGELHDYIPQFIEAL